MATTGLKALANSQTTMPELPEVETTVRSLSATLTGRIITSVRTDWPRHVEAYIGEIMDTHQAAAALLTDVPAESRKLVTNHDSLGYFAARYAFEIIGVVIPGGSTLAEPSAAQLANLVEVLDREEIRAVFAETTQPTQLAEAIAAEATYDVKVVELFTGSLGHPGSGAETYLGMIMTNTRLIADALRPDLET